jgi:hypothetical protein
MCDVPGIIIINNIIIIIIIIIAVLIAQRFRSIGHHPGNHSGYFWRLLESFIYLKSQQTHGPR